MVSCGLISFIETMMFGKGSLDHIHGEADYSFYDTLYEE